MFDKNIAYWKIPHITLIAFRQVLTKIFPAAFIQLHNYDLSEKARLKLSPLIQTLSSRTMFHRVICQVSPFLPKMSKNCYTHQLWIPFPWIFMGKPGDGSKFYPTAKNLLVSPIRRISLNGFKVFAIKSFISSPSNSNFQVITLCNLHL